MVCETIIKLNYMEKILLSCPLLYLNGTVTNELLKGEKVIAIVVENTLMSLKNQIRMSYRGAERECENLTFADGHYGYLSLKKSLNCGCRIGRKSTGPWKFCAKTASMPIFCWRARFTGRRAATSFMRLSLTLLPAIRWCRTKEVLMFRGQRSANKRNHF